MAKASDRALRDYPISLQTAAQALWDRTIDAKSSDQASRKISRN